MALFIICACFICGFIGISFDNIIADTPAEDTAGFYTALIALGNKTGR